MAIKLNNNTAGGQAITGNQIYRGAQSFGSANLQYVDIPGESGQKIQSALQVGNAAANAQERIAANFGREAQMAAATGQAWAQGLSQVSDLLSSYAQAEDETNYNNAMRDIQTRYGEARAKNLERANMREISYMQMADENKKEYEAIHKEVLDNTPWNYNHSRDLLNAKVQDDLSTNYVRDIEWGKNEVFKEKKNNYLFQIKTVADEFTSINDLMTRGPAAMSKLISHDMAGVVGVDIVAHEGKQAMAAKFNSLASQQMKTDPSSIIRDIDNGTLNPLVDNGFMSKEDLAALRAEGASNVVKLDNARKDADYKMAGKIEDQFQMEEMQAKVAGVPGKTNKEYETTISTLMQLGNYEAARRLQKSYYEVRGFDEATIDKNNKIDLKVSKTNSTSGLSPEEQESWMERKDPKYTEIMKSGNKMDIFNYIGPTIQQHGKITKPQMAALIAPLPDDSPKELVDARAKTINSLAITAPNTYKDVPESVQLESTMIANGSSLIDARKQVMAMNETSELIKIVPQEKLKTYSAYTDPSGTIESYLDAQEWGNVYSPDRIDQSVIKDFQLSFHKRIAAGDDEEQAKINALASLNVGKVKDSNGKVWAQRNSPERYLTTDAQRNGFYQEVSDAVTEVNKSTGKNITNYVVTASPTHDKDKSYVIINLDNRQLVKDANGTPITIVPDPEMYEDKAISELIPPKEVPNSVKPFASNIKAELSMVSSQYPNTVGKNPLLLWGVYGVESTFGTNKNVSSAGAEGPFQFIPGTAKQYGINNPNDFKQSANGAAKYLDHLITRTSKIGKNLKWDDRTITLAALAAYNWGEGNIEAWAKPIGTKTMVEGKIVIGTGGDLLKLPSTVRDYAYQVYATAKG